MDGMAEELCRSLLKWTDAILRAAERGDLDAVGPAIAGRQKVLDELAAVRAKCPAEFAACQPMLRRAAEMDARAGRAVKDWRERIRGELKRRNRSFGPLMKYGSSRFGLSAGMVVDRME